VKIHWPLQISSIIATYIAVLLSKDDDNQLVDVEQICHLLFESAGMKECKKASLMWALDSINENIESLSN
jgi:hypothetical protein